MERVVFVYTTYPSIVEAETAGRALVERRLAACVNVVGPIRSIYRWKHKVHNEAEYLLIIKTTASHADRLQSAFKELHPYELPECVQLPIVGGSDDYLNWLAAEVSSGE